MSKYINKYNIVLLFFSLLSGTMYLADKAGIKGIEDLWTTSEPTPQVQEKIIENTSRPIPTVKLDNLVETDPIVDCGPGETSKQYIKDKQSNCKNYVDCGLNNGTWTLMLKSECDNKLKEETASNNQPCYIFNQTYYVSPETCNYYKEEAAKAFKSGTNYNPTSSYIQPTSTPDTTYSDLNRIARENCAGQIKLSCSAKEQELLNLIQYGADVQRNQEKLNTLRAQCTERQQGCVIQYPY